jgi:serine/threonine protein kinase
MNKEMRDLIYPKYDIIEIIGKGSYGCVTKANCKKTSKVVALKVI